jgi:hypothetical protein
MRAVEIDAQGVLEVISGAYECPGEDDIELHIQGLNVARVQGGRVVSLACTHPSHGVRREFLRHARRLQQALSVNRMKVASMPCPDCGGGGWLDIDSPEAKKIRSMALCFGIFRGIPINTK